MVLRDRLRDHGYRITTQRQTVFDAVEGLEHGTPDEILGQAQTVDELLNLSTVYRNLEVLEAVGLVRHAHLGHGSPTYHLADRHRHLQVVCGTCGQVQEVPVAVAHDLVSAVKADHGFSIDIDHFDVVAVDDGVCAPRTGT